jgi:nitroimidazol reductase NimA-like FMN-containing flavoprotein (pyridoxamine 5'-phosphate oxidase superfamily)
VYTLTGDWDREAVEAYLHDRAIPIRLGCRTPAGVPWMLSLWYQYRDETFHCATAAEADVVRHVEHEPHVSFEVSDDQPPYKGVRGHGLVTVEPDGKPLLRELLERYVGGTDSGFARRLLAPDRDEVRLVLEPRKLYSWDFGDRMDGPES